jgi:hypothetical protein
MEDIRLSLDTKDYFKRLLDIKTERILYGNSNPIQNIWAMLINIILNTSTNIRIC